MYNYTVHEDKIHCSSRLLLPIMIKPSSSKGIKSQQTFTTDLLFAILFHYMTNLARILDKGRKK